MTGGLIRGKRERFGTHRDPGRINAKKEAEMADAAASQARQSHWELEGPSPETAGSLTCPRLDRDFWPADWESKFLLL